MHRIRKYLLIMASQVGALLFAHETAADLDGESIRVIQTAVTDGTTDQASLAAAWRNVATAEMADLPDVLAAFDQATPVGVNWLSSAVDGILQRAKRDGQSVSPVVLSQYVLDVGRGSRSRQMALELLRDASPDTVDAIVLDLKNDPEAVMRYPAIELLLQSAKEETDAVKQLNAYQEIFDLALDEKHVVQSVVALREHGHSVDHIRKFGLLMHWQIIGPFDYADGGGFDEAYPPESLSLENFAGASGIYSNVNYPGKTSGETVGWKAYVNTSRNGSVDLNKAVGELRDAVAYGATVFESDREQSVELRLRQQNSAKLWLNGDLVFSQSIGHTGNFFDQYIVPVKLRKGPNLILVKSCQWAGAAEHPFLKNWQLSVRVTDATGNAVLATNRPPTPQLDPLPAIDGGRGKAEQPKSDKAVDASNGETKDADE